MTPWTAALQASLVLQCLPEFVQPHIHWVNHAIQPFHSLWPPFSPAFSLSQHQGLFQWLALCIRWPNYWSFSFSVSPSKEYSGLISFRIDWFGLHAVQGTLKSLLQHHSLKAPKLWHSAFFMVQLSHLYMTTGRIIALTIRTFVSKVMFLLFNMLSRLVIAFLPRSKPLLAYSKCFINKFMSVDLYVCVRKNGLKLYTTFCFVIFLINNALWTFSC